MRTSIQIGLVAIVVAFYASVLHAHPHHDHSLPESLPQIAQSHGLRAGFLHPFLGIDHLLAMVAVGLLSVQAGGTSLWRGPVSFLTGTALGGAIGLMNLPVPGIEILIAMSLVALGLALTTKAPQQMVVLYSSFLVFGFFHGHAHGTEASSLSQATSYLVGFLLGSIILHATGVMLGLIAMRSGRTFENYSLRISGAAVAMTGLVLIISGH